MSYLFIKNIFDRVFALVALILFAPVFLILIILIKIKISKQVFFKQVRPGYRERFFTLIKFKSMNDKVDENGNYLPESERLNNFGRWLRKTSLDELPELINILKGDMSFVGPRPLLVEYLPLYNDQERKRHDVKPGLSGWAQINGRNSLAWENKLFLDNWYVKNINFFLDFSIILKTVIKVLKKESINLTNEISMEPFKGTNNKD